jgi:hypothetical protein
MILLIPTFLSILPNQTTPGELDGKALDGPLGLGRGKPERSLPSNEWARFRLVRLDFRPLNQV